MLRFYVLLPKAIIKTLLLIINRLDGLAFCFALNRLDLIFVGLCGYDVIKILLGCIGGLDYCSTYVYHQVM